MNFNYFLLFHLIENEIERDLMTDGYDRPDGHKIASVGLFLSFSIENEMIEDLPVSFLNVGNHLAGSQGKEKEGKRPSDCPQD